MFILHTTGKSLVTTQRIWVRWRQLISTPPLLLYWQNPMILPRDRSQELRHPPLPRQIHPPGVWVSLIIRSVKIGIYLFHTLTHIPMNERMLGIQRIKFVVKTAPCWGNSGSTGRKLSRSCNQLLVMIAYLERVPRERDAFTGQWKWVPVDVQIVRKRGCDGVLCESFWKLEDKGIVKKGQVCMRDSHAATVTHQRLINYCRLHDLTGKSNALLPVSVFGWCVCCGVNCRRGIPLAAKWSWHDSRQF